MRNLRWKIRQLGNSYRVKTYTLDPFRFIGGILFIIAWATGAVSGILAWALLCVYISFTFKWKR